MSIIGSFSLYTQQWYMPYRFADRTAVPTWSCSQAVWHITLLCVQWKTAYHGQRNCPKHVEFYSKNKFEKSIHLVGFTIRIYYDARSPERQNNLNHRPHYLYILTCFQICSIMSLLIKSVNDTYTQEIVSISLKDWERPRNAYLQ